MAGSINPIWIYAASLAFEKGFSLITVPLTAAFVSPADYGDYEVVLSLTGFVLILLGLGIGETLIRFASTRDDAGQKRCAAELLGGLLVIAVTLGTFVQVLAAPVAELLDIQVSMWALRWTLLSSSMTTLIDLPIVWFRLRDSAGLFFWFSIIRTVAHVAVTWVALVAGYGVEGVIILNAWVAIGFAITLFIWFARDVGIAWSTPMIRHIFSYGFPILVGGLALFAITKLDRWFLVGNVSQEEIGLFGLASRLALAATLAVAPVYMWWYPKRIAALATDEGRRQSVSVGGYCFALIVLPALVLVLGAPFAINLIFPSSYAQATNYLPGCVLAVALGQIVPLINVGVFARPTGYLALLIDCAAALAALLLLFFLVPWWGVHGAIACAVIAQAVRCILYFVFGNVIARLNYPLLRSITVTAACIAAVIFAPPETSELLRIIWSFGSVLIVVCLLHTLRIAPIPPGIFSMGRSRRRAL